MIDDTAAADERNRPPENEHGDTGERVAFCQQCGRPLTAETVRRAGAAVYCEPCLIARLDNPGQTRQAPGWNPVNNTVPPSVSGQPASGPVPPSNEPSPWLAALLGLIPGVGAMYNGQYAKGVAHLVIFAVLESFANNVNGVFGLLVAAWVFYQAFDAYHTAKARRDGTPVPDAFGLNNIGDRMGFGRNWPGSAARPVTSATTAGWATADAAAGSAPPPQPPNWSGYVPPTNFGVNAPPPPQPTAYASAPPTGAPPTGASWAQPPYAATYPPDPRANTPPWTTPAGAAVPPPMPPLPLRRFPIGAAWLIAIGLIFLFANLNGSWQLGGSWAVAIVLAALGAFILFRRIEMVRAWAALAAETDPAGQGTGFPGGMAAPLALQVRWPVMLLVLALLFALQAAGIRTLGQTWGILLIAFGALLILERTLGRTDWDPSTPGYPAATPRPPAVPPASPRPGSTRKDGQ